MPSLRDIRTKIKGIKSVTQVTRTMKLVSSVKFAKAQVQISNTLPFAAGIEELVHSIDGNTPHPFFEKDRNGKNAVLLVTSDRGLCGSFNNNLIKKCMDFVSSGWGNFVFFAAGRKGRDFLARRDFKIENEYVGIFKKLNYGDAEIISEDLTGDFLSGKVSSVWAVYNKFESAGRHRDVVEKILPIEREKQETPGHISDYLFEPAKEILIGQLLRRYFNSKIYRILLESNSGEQFARMNAMNMATKNANEIIDCLVLEMNKQRQMSITREISEIIGAAEVLNK